MKQKHGRKKEEKRSGDLGSLPLITPNAAGIDIGSEEHWVAVPEDRDEKPVRSFRCFTADLQAMATWLKACGVTTVAMESTGVYWIPAYQILEAHGFEVKLVNARHVKNVPGRKSDVSDCQWIQRLHTYGLLSASFRPDNEVCVLRSYWRHRDSLVRYASSHIQHMQKALTEMNVQVHKVLADITGVTGMRIIRAILAGERDREKLALMRAPGVKSTPEEIAKALEGDYREEHLFVLRQAVELYDFYQRQIEACDREIEACLCRFDTKADLESNPLPPLKKGKKKPKDGPLVDLRAHLHRMTGVDFTQIDGLDVLTVQTILSETGLDPGAFRTMKHFTSWLALSPDNRVTGGKVKSTRTRKVANRAAMAFRIAAQSLANSTSAIGGFYRRIRARLGAPKAITATAHKLARIFYTLWTTGKQYVDLGAQHYEQRYKDRIVRSMKKRLHDLGYVVTIEPTATAATL
jgi:transposase